MGLCYDGGLRLESYVSIKSSLSMKQQKKKRTVSDVTVLEVLDEVDDVVVI